MILPEVISKEPLGPVTQADEFAWFNVVRWVNFALVNAEELGIASENVAEATGSRKSDVRRFVGAEGGLGKMLGLEDNWALRAVRAVGNYSEIYERNLGVKSRLGIPRGLNQLWSMGACFTPPAALRRRSVRRIGSRPEPGGYSCSFCCSLVRAARASLMRASCCSRVIP